MIITATNRRWSRWSDLTAREKTLLAVRGIVQFALLAAALADIHRRPAEEINGTKWLKSGR